MRASKARLPTLKEFVNSYWGSVAVSVVVGFGLASLFRKACSGNGCVVIRAPPHAGLRKNVYIQDGRCYKYEPRAANCDGDVKERK